MEQGRKRQPSRRTRKSGRPCTAYTALRMEALEQRRLLHAGHEHEFPDPSVLEMLEGAPNPDPFPTAAAFYPLTSIPSLSSLPGAPATLYLDFDGHFESTWGSYSSITTPVYSQDADLTTFSDVELTSIENVWARVSEDYAPFRVNVTTALPPSFANGVAMRVAIGGDSTWAGGSYGGIAYVNSFTNSIVNTVYVFPNNLSNNNKNIAEASSHESGHSFGLQHQSLYNAEGVKTAEYYSGSGGRAPIMGNSYSATRGLWWNGTSTSSTTIQDDLAVLSRAANGFGYRTDDHGNTAATATPLSGSDSLLSASGIITQTSDVDYFSFSTPAGQASFSATVPASINNLDTRLELRDAAGNLITSAAPTNSFSATITTTLAAGSYRLVVASQGSYGDIGQYTVNATVPAAAAAHEVLARSVFYNQSGFDGDNAAINAADDAAVDTSKVAYRPGDGLAGSANVTSYVRGINGIMVDLAGSHGTLSVNDFTFKMSAPGLDANNSPGSWVTAPAPTFAVRTGVGTSGSDRIEFVWADGAIKDRWLEVIVEGNDAEGSFNANTGLAASDIFFFGNKIGATFLHDDPGAFKSDQFDQLAVRYNQGITLSPTSVFDFNRDFAVDPIDEIIARFNQGYLIAIDIANPPGASAAPGGGEASAVATALSAAGPPSSVPTLAESSATPARLEPYVLPAPSYASPSPRADEVRALALGAVSDELAIQTLDDELLERLATHV